MFPDLEKADRDRHSALIRKSRRNDGHRLRKLLYAQVIESKARGVPLETVQAEFNARVQAHLSSSNSLGARFRAKQRPASPQAPLDLRAAVRAFVSATVASEMDDA